MDHISDINLPYSKIAREYLLKEGLPPDRIIKTGSPMYEVLNYLPKIKKSKALSRYKLVEKYFVISAHREENIEVNLNFRKIINILDQLSTEYKLPIIVSTHPQNKKQN